MAYGDAVPTAIRDRSIVILDLNAGSIPVPPPTLPTGLRNYPNVKGYLRIEQTDLDEDTELEILLLAAKEELDRYCNNPFVDASNNPLPIPIKVELAILKLCMRSYDMRNPSVRQETTVNEGTVTWTVEIDWVRDDVKQYRLEPGLGEGW